MITITSQASRQIKSEIRNDRRIIGVRITLKPNGIAGLTYSLEHVTQRDMWSDERSITGIRVFTEPKDDSYLENLTIDFVDGKFVFSV